MRADMVAAYEANLKCGVARELARIDLPLSIYTYAYWKIDLHNLLRFLKLRLDEHAQWEIRQYAQVIAGIVKELWPITWQAFSNYTLNSVKFSFAEQLVLCNIVNDPSLSFTLPHQSEKDMVINACTDAGMGKTEIGEFLSKIRRMSMLKDSNNDLYTLDITNARTAEYFQSMVENA
jgi:thymidylate synthase (FAD)